MRQFDACLNACRISRHDCQQCADAVRDLPDMEACARICDECEVVCSKCIDALKAENWGECLHCSEVCARCAAECDRHDDLEICRNCAESCRRCAYECRQAAVRAA